MNRRQFFGVVLAGAAAVTHAAFPTPRRLTVVFDGNSLTDTSCVYSWVVPYCDHVLRDTALDTLDIRSHVVAVSGQTTQACIDRFSSFVAPCYDPTRKNIVLLWEGTNDLAQTGDVNGCYARIRAYCTQARAGGWWPVVVSVLPANRPVAGALDFGVMRDSLNARVRANWREFAAAFVDLDADPIGQGISAVNYLADGVHLTSDGQRVIAGRVAPVLAQMSGAAMWLPWTGA